MAERVASSRQRLADLVREASRGGPLERVVEAISPKWAQRRAASRVQLALAGGGYHGGGRGRPAMRNFNPGGGDANDDTLLDLPDLRDRSRDLVRNAPIATGAIGTLTTNIVGTGLALQPAIDAKLLGLTDDEAKAWQDKTNAEWKLHAESVQIDIARRLDFYGLQALGLRSALENGDAWAFLTDKEEPGHPYSLALQLVEADRICNPTGQPDTDTLIAGVKLDADGMPLAVQVANRHPRGLRIRGGAIEWKEHDIRNARGQRVVLQLADLKRIGQVRGVPLLAPVIEPLKQLERYTEAELQAAVIAGTFAVFVRMNPEAFDTLFDEDAQSRYIASASNWDGTVPNGTVDGPGKAVNLLPGEEIDAQNPGRPNAAFDPFFQAIVRQIGVALEIPFEVLIKHYTSSYTAARAATLEAWKFFRGRRAWLATQFCQPVYEAWLEEAVALGRVVAPGFFADPARRRAWCGAQWIGDGPGSIDPQKEVAAAAERIALGISTREKESIEYDGIPWDQKHRQLAKERQMREDDGLDAEIVQTSTASGTRGAPANDGDPAAPAAPGKPAPAAPARPGGRVERVAQAAEAQAAQSAAAMQATAQVVASAVAHLGQALAAVQDLLGQLGAHARDVDQQRAAVLDLTATLADQQARLTEALIERAAEPAVAHVELTQADVHIHTHAAAPVAVRRAVEYDDAGEIRAVVETPLPAGGRSH